jgi:hypothetical protein
MKAAFLHDERKRRSHGAGKHWHLYFREIHGGVAHDHQ